MKSIIKKTYILLIAVLLALFIKLFVLQIFTINGISMEPTIPQNTIIIVNKLSYGLDTPFGCKQLISWGKPKKDDIVIYLYENKIVVKRCVATEGTPLEYSIKYGYNLKVGEKVYPLSEEQYHLMKYTDKVPNNTILAIGDNYSASIDSRNYGFIPVYNILGKVINK